jgi:hypothetical protein
MKVKQIGLKLSWVLTCQSSTLCSYVLYLHVFIQCLCISNIQGSSNICHVYINVWITNKSLFISILVWLDHDFAWGGKNLFSTGLSLISVLLSEDIAIVTPKHCPLSEASWSNSTERHLSCFLWLHHTHKMSCWSMLKSLAFFISTLSNLSSSTFLKSHHLQMLEVRQPQLTWCSISGLTIMTFFQLRCLCEHTCLVEVCMMFVLVYGTFMLWLTNKLEFFSLAVHYNVFACFVMMCQTCVCMFCYDVSVKHVFVCFVMMWVSNMCLYVLLWCECQTCVCMFFCDVSVKHVFVCFVMMWVSNVFVCSVMMCQTCDYMFCHDVSNVFVCSVMCQTCVCLFCHDVLNMCFYVMSLYQCQTCVCMFSLHNTTIN